MKKHILITEIETDAEICHVGVLCVDIIKKTLDVKDVNMRLQEALNEHFDAEVDFEALKSIDITSIALICEEKDITATIHKEEGDEFKTKIHLSKAFLY